MKFINWYNGGDISLFHRFCTQNKRELISIHLKSSEIVKGLLHDHHFKPIEAAGVFVFLTNKAIHPAFYALSDIVSLHYLASTAIDNSSGIRYDGDIAPSR